MSPAINALSFWTVGIRLRFLQVPRRGLHGDSWPRMAKPGDLLDLQVLRKEVSGGGGKRAGEKRSLFLNGILFAFTFAGTQHRVSVRRLVASSGKYGDTRMISTGKQARIPSDNLPGPCFPFVFNPIIMDISPGSARILRSHPSPTPQRSSCLLLSAMISQISKVKAHSC